MEALRREVFERDGYRCQHLIVWTEWDSGIGKARAGVRCHEAVTWETGHLAHVISRGRGGKDEVSNCVVKCASCHIGIEHSYGPSGVKPVPKKVNDE